MEGRKAGTVERWETVGRWSTSLDYASFIGEMISVLENSRQMSEGEVELHTSQFNLRGANRVVTPAWSDSQRLTSTESKYAEADSGKYAYFRLR